MSAQEERKILDKIEDLTMLVAETRHDQAEALRDQKEFQDRVEGMLAAWTNAKGFARVLKWLVGLLIGVGVVIQVFKQLGLSVLIK